MIAHGTTGVFYEATQLDLDRRVALKVLARGSSAARSPEHPNIVAVYTAGSSEHGDFVAMQLVRGGRTLADRLRDGSLRAREARAIFGDVAAALGKAHESGLVHGAVTAENVLLDSAGRALLSGFRRGDESGAEADRAALAALVSDTSPARRTRWVAVAAVGLAATAVALVLLARPDRKAGVPAVLPGAAVLGSALPSSSVESLDCTGAAPSGASPACSVAQTALPGRTMVVPRAGVIRRWTVRGANGDLALQVLRRRGRAYYLVAHTKDATIPDGGVHTLPANLPVAPGDLVGLEVAPGAAVGVRRVTSGSRTVRWFGPIVYEVRRPERGAGTGFDHELLLRVEYIPGATWRIDGELRGDAAKSAPAGAVVERFVVRQPPRPVLLSIVRVEGRVVVDLIDSGHRVVRLPLSDAEVAGELRTIEIRKVRFGLPIVRVRWQNRDTLVTHEYVVGARALTLLG